MDGGGPSLLWSGRAGKCSDGEERGDRGVGDRMARVGHAKSAVSIIAFPKSSPSKQ
jgi:hypothetical protein